MARRMNVDEDQVGVFHVFQRVVRRAYLGGNDQVTGKCFDYRREWIQKRLQFLAPVFGIELLAFAVMSNQVHLVLGFFGGQPHRIDLLTRKYLLHSGRPPRQINNGIADE